MYKSTRHTPQTSPNKKFGDYLGRHFGSFRSLRRESNCWAEDMVRGNSDMLFHPEAMIRML